MTLTKKQKERLLELAKRTIFNGPVGTRTYESPALGSALEAKGLVIAHLRQTGDRGKRYREAICQITDKGLALAIELKAGGPILSL